MSIEEEGIDEDEGIRSNEDILPQAIAIKKEQGFPTDTNRIQGSHSWIKRDLFSNRNSLKQAFVLKEILDKPKVPQTFFLGLLAYFSLALDLESVFFTEMLKSSSFCMHLLFHSQVLGNLHFSFGQSSIKPFFFKFFSLVLLLALSLNRVFGNAEAFIQQIHSKQ